MSVGTEGLLGIPGLRQVRLGGKSPPPLTSQWLIDHSQSNSSSSSPPPGVRRHRAGDGVLGPEAGHPDRPGPGRPVPVGRPAAAGQPDRRLLQGEHPRRLQAAGGQFLFSPK